jgi:hypothetical protein
LRKEVTNDNVLYQSRAVQDLDDFCISVWSGAGARRGPEFPHQHRVAGPLVEVLRGIADAEADSDRIPGSGSLPKDEKPYFRSTISIQFGWVPIGKPDAGNPHVRFDERGRETELAQRLATAPFLNSTTPMGDEA